jgi:hypothetical protein
MERLTVHQDGSIGAGRDEIARECDDALDQESV